jgi:two-component system KDP operon response regulator KdpE
MLNDTPRKPVAVIIDDEIQLRRLLRLSLEASNYTVYDAATGQLGLAEIAFRRPDVVVLDLGLPDMSGMEVISRLREWNQVPLIVLSVRDSEEEKITALQKGADDYVTKPFSNGELVARLAAVRRHFQPSAGATVFTLGHLEVDLSSHQVKVNGKTVKLTGTEYALLSLFIRNPGKVLTHPQILEAVWGPENVEKTHYLHVYMTHLRNKVELNPQQPELLLTVLRVGYRLNNKLASATPTPAK